jgi:hypothetical protein
MWRQLTGTKVLIKAGVLALLIALGLAVRPAYRAFRGYRTDRSLAAAQEAARHENWTHARDKARTVLLVRRDDFDAYRIWVRARLELGEPSAFMAAAQLISDSRATRDERLEVFRMIVSQAPQAVVLAVYYQLPKEVSEQPSFRAAIIPLLIQRGEIDLAERGLREVALPMAAPDVQLEVLRTLCSRPGVQRIAEARRIFAQLVAANAGDEALAALLLLGSVPGALAPGEPLPDVTAWLQQQPKATTRHHLLAIEPVLTAQPETAETCYQKTCARFLATGPGELGDWLVRHGQSAMAVRILAEPAKASPDAYLSHLRALLDLQRKAEIEAALASPPAAVDMVELEIMQARFAALCGDPIAADAAWTRALNCAAFDTSRNRFLEIAHTAASCHAAEAAENAWVAAIRLGWGPLPLYSDLLPVYDSLAGKGRSEDLLAMLRSLRRFEPGNADLLNNLCYLSLIHGLMTPGQVIDAMTKLVEQEGSSGYHATLMLAEMMDDQPAAALARMPQFRYDIGVSRVLKTALEGTARLLAGDTAAGSAMLMNVKWRGLMPQEKSVFRHLLVRLRISDLPVPELDSPKMVTAPEQTPAWRKALEHPADMENPKLAADPDQTPAWRKAVVGLGKDRSDEDLPPLPASKVH